MRKKTHKYTILAILFILIFSSNNSGLIGKISNNETNIVNNSNLKVSDSWSLSHIYITNDNWSEYDVPWIQNRTGTWNDPHIIENITVNAGGIGSPILIEDSNDYFIIRNCTIMNSDSGTSDAGINFINVQNGTITENFIESNGNYGIRLFNLNEKICNITISNNTIRNNGDWGIYMRGYENNSIIGNQIKNNIGGVYLYWSSNYNEIMNNTITTTTAYDLYFHANSDENIISNNIIISEDVYGIYFFNAGNEIFKNNKLYGAGFNLYSITLGYRSSMQIQDTTVNDRKVYYYVSEIGLGPANFTNAGQIMLIDCDNSIISNANLSRATIGLWLSNDCDGNQISNIEANNGYDGITLNGGCDNNVLTNVTADYNSQYGLYMISGDNNIITESSFSSNQEDGLYIYSLCDFNNISKSSIDYNSHFGINLRTNCLNNTFSSNSLSYNDWGFYLQFNVDYTTIYRNLIRDNLNTGVEIHTTDCNETNIYYNNFITNGLHAFDDGSASQWDNGLIGNYWDDYTGVDLDSNGIGDTPYNITGLAKSADRYPLMTVIDFIEPIVILNSPSEGARYKYNAPTFNLTISDLSLDSGWYTINNLPTKYFFAVTNGYNIILVNQTLWNSLNQGLYTFTFYVNDTSGNLSILELDIYKDLTGFDPDFGLPEILAILVLIIILLSVIIIIIGVRRRNRRRY